MIRVVFVIKMFSTLSDTVNKLFTDGCQKQLLPHFILLTRKKLNNIKYWERYIHVHKSDTIMK